MHRFPTGLLQLHAADAPTRGEPAVPKAFSYIRWSSPEQAKGDSLRRQTEAAEAFARQHGLELDRELTFRDAGVSAFKGRNVRTGALRAFLSAVEDGMIDEGSYLIVESLDRLSRGDILEANGLFSQIINAGITLVTLADGKIYSRESVIANPTDMILSIVIMIRAHDESRMKASRVRASWDAKRRRAAEGDLTPPGRPPSWLQWTRDGWLIDQTKADIIRRVFSMFLAGAGREKITRALSKEGVPPLGGGERWQSNGVRYILTNPAVAGALVLKEFQGSKRVVVEEIPGFYPAVISMDDFMSAQAMIASRSPTRGPNQKVVNIIGGLAKCPECGGAVGMMSKRPSWRYLRCRAAKEGSKCHARAVRYEPVENALLLWLPRALLEIPPSDPNLDHDLSMLYAENAGLEERIYELAQEIGMGTKGGVGVRALRQTMRELEGQLDDLRDRRADLLARSSLARLVERRLLEAIDLTNTEPLDRAKLNAIMRQLFAEAIVQARTVELVWRHRPDVASVVLTGMEPAEP